VYSFSRHLACVHVVNMITPITVPR